jgi:hypothetical protein
MNCDECRWAEICDKEQCFLETIKIGGIYGFSNQFGGKTCGKNFSHST